MNTATLLERWATNFFSHRLYYHTVFWVCYSGFWHVVNAHNPVSLSSFIVTLTFWVFHAGAAYTNIYFLMPHFFMKRQYASYLLLLLIDILFFSVLLKYALSSLFYWTQEDLLPIAIGSTIASVATVSAVKLFKERFLMERRQKKLEQEKVTTELNWLKAQLNPHFLFNALNSIYVLIKKDPDLAAESLAQFSQMLRYQLYECNDATIPLSQELQFLNNFIGLSKLRKNRLDLELDLPEVDNDQQIAPFLLIPFVENAFKHVSDFKDRPNWIQIEMRPQDQQFYFRVANSIDPVESKEDILKVGGIGLQNVGRRLSLLYGQNFHLNQTQDSEQYQVELIIPIQNPKVKHVEMYRD